MTHVLHKTITLLFSSPLSLLWLQNCVVVSVFDSDYKQIIQLILSAEVSANVHVFVCLGTWTTAEICAYFSAVESMNLQNCSFAQIRWNLAYNLWNAIYSQIFLHYTNIPSFLDESYSRVKMKGTYIDMRTCLRYIKRSTWVHPHQEHPVGSNLGQLTMRIMWKLNPRFNLEKNFEPCGLFTKPRLLRSELSQVIPGMSVKF